jgi:hypothetical protein
MSATLLADVEKQIKQYWVDTNLFMDEVKEDTLLPSLVNKDYQGEIKKEGDTVRVSQINRPLASRKTIGVTGYNTFETTKLSTSYVDIKADQIISAAYEFEDLLELQSQIKKGDSKIRQGMLEALEIELNNYLYGLVNPSTSSPDHVINAVADFNATQLGTMKKKASQARWKRDEWYALLDPSYHLDFTNATTMTSSDYGAEDQPLIGGQFARKRYGFNILEDNSDGILQLSPGSAGEDCGLIFHPDFLHLVMQEAPKFELANLLSNKQFGFVMVVKMIVGSKLGIGGDVKHIKVYNT